MRLHIITCPSSQPFSVTTTARYMKGRQIRRKCGVFHVALACVLLILAALLGSSGAKSVVPASSPQRLELPGAPWNSLELDDGQDSGPRPLPKQPCREQYSTHTQELGRLLHGERSSCHFSSSSRLWQSTRNANKLTKVRYNINVVIIRAAHSCRPILSA